MTGVQGQLLVLSNSFLPQAFIEHLLCARPNASYCTYITPLSPSGLRGGVNIPNTKYPWSSVALADSPSRLLSVPPPAHRQQDSKKSLLCLLPHFKYVVQQLLGDGLETAPFQFREARGLPWTTQLLHGRAGLRLDDQL